ncbi:MAG: pyridoxamine 5'-phosphate oxidase family protein [Actinomycetota bacterium]|nr:pyridoxamine 5'-phosphate oxidase family protein [Actinomycetota bacterium]
MPAEWSRWKTILLETQRRNGNWVATPVTLVVDNRERAYFRTYAESGKAKRLRNNPTVRLARASFLGKRKSSVYSAVARQLRGDDADCAKLLLRRRHPLLHACFVPLMHRLRGWTTIYFELAAEPAAGSPGD